MGHSRELLGVVGGVRVRVAEGARGEHLAADLAGGGHRLPLVHRPHVDPQ